MPGLRCAAQRYFYLHKYGPQKLPVEDELQQELSWASSRPSSQAVSAAHALRWDEDKDQEPWKQALNLSEERFRVSYMTSSPDEVVQLNQNPDNGFGATSRRGQLQTIIGNAHMLWTEVISPCRWMAGSEALATLGFPVVPYLWGLRPEEFPHLCAFNVPRTGRTSRTMLIQAGNSMNVYVMAVILLHGLTQWQARETPGIMCSIRLARSSTLLGCMIGISYWEQAEHGRLLQLQ